MPTPSRVGTRSRCQPPVSHLTMSLRTPRTDARRSDGNRSHPDAIAHAATDSGLPWTMPATREGEHIDHRRRPLIIDGHEDIAFNVLCANRDYRRSARETRTRETGLMDVREALGLPMLGLPEWITGRVAVIFATIFTEPAGSSFSGHLNERYSTAEDAHRIARRQLTVYETLTAAAGPFRLVRDQRELAGVLATWDEGRDEAQRQIGLVLLMENADPIREPDELDFWYDAGLRIVGPAWMSTRYCGGTFEPGPLTDLGRRLLDGMAARQMLLDTSHMAEEAFFQAVERYDGAIIASHSNPRRFVDGDRHLSDEMIRALVARDGVIGQVPFNAFLVHGWSRRAGHAKAAAGVDTVVRNIDHVCGIAGSARHVAFGSDFDGGFGAESTPDGIDTVADLQRVAGALARQGYSDADVDAITHGNWLRMLGRALC